MGPSTMLSKRTAKILINVHLYLILGEALSAQVSSGLPDGAGGEGRGDRQREAEPLDDRVCGEGDLNKLRWLDVSNFSNLRAFLIYNTLLLKS